MRHDSEEDREPPRPSHAAARRPAALCRTVLLAAAQFAASAAFAQIPHFDHVVVVVMENHSYDDIVGNTSDAPWINALAGSGANFASSFAIEHPSEPNYLDLFSGSNQGITDDSCPHTFSNVANLGRQLIDAGFTFVGFSEDLPAAKPKACTSGNYARKHNPWVNFSNVPAASNQSFAAFPSDFSNLPTLSFVVPNLCNDMHNCPIATGDTWLQTHIEPYVMWARTHNSLLVLTWDEDDYSQSNQIPTLFAGALVIAGSYVAQIDHYTVLATLESIYALPPIAGAETRSAITEVWDSTIFKADFD
jgi:hypothetical protein